MWMMALLLHNNYDQAHLHGKIICMFNVHYILFDLHGKTCQIYYSLTFIIIIESNYIKFCNCITFNMFIRNNE